MKAEHFAKTPQAQKLHSIVAEKKAGAAPAKPAKVKKMVTQTVHFGEHKPAAKAAKKK